MNTPRDGSDRKWFTTSRSASDLACAVALLCLISACKLDSVVFGAEKTDAYVLPQTVVPDSLRREVTFPSGSETLHGFWLRQPGASSRLTVVFSHGKGKNLAGQDEWSHADYLWQSGFDVLTYDYRGFGRSTGKSVDEITLASDARSALTFALTQPGVTLGRTVSYGHSLGSAPAITLASTTPGLRALVVEAGFSNGQAMAQSAVPLGIPVKWLLREPMLNTKRIADVPSPVLVLHGDQDRLIPVAQGRDLYAAARDPKQLRIVPGAGHENVPQTLGVAVFRTVIRTFTSADVP
jgi:pimeloyl-ACP methyl ester carboxylesterase